MAPAFSSPRQAGAFAALLLVILLLPVLLGKSLLPPRERIYSSAPWSAGAYPYLHEQIFQQKGDIDIAFVGSSLEYLGIDTPEVQKQLSEKLGRQAVVRSLCWYWLGFDALYFITEDLLRNRKVHMLVFTDEASGEIIHEQTDRWFRFADNAQALAGLPPRIVAAFYSAAILGAPQHLLNLIEPEQPLFPFSNEQFNIGRPLHTQNPFDRLGSLSVEDVLDVNRPFVKYSPRSQAKPSDVCIYSTDTKDKFLFAGSPMSPAEVHFAQKFTDLAKKYGAKLVFLSLPFLEHIRSQTITIDHSWPELLHSDITILGIPPAKLFANIPDDDIEKLYFDHYHLNQNGQRYFTSAITPALVDLYCTQNHL
jgi:hypothetical protein